MEAVAEDTYVIVMHTGLLSTYFTVEKNGVALAWSDGTVRLFQTRSSARKRISRERKQNYHG